MHEAVYVTKDKRENPQVITFCNCTKDEVDVTSKFKSRKGQKIHRNIFLAQKDMVLILYSKTITPIKNKLHLIWA